MTDNSDHLLFVLLACNIFTIEFFSIGCNFIASALPVIWLWEIESYCVLVSRMAAYVWHEPFFFCYLIIALHWKVEYTIIFYELHRWIAQWNLNSFRSTQSSFFRTEAEVEWTINRIFRPKAYCAVQHIKIHRYRFSCAWQCSCEKVCSLLAYENLFLSARCAWCEFD